MAELPGVQRAKSSAKEARIKEAKYLQMARRARPKGNGTYSAFCEIAHKAMLMRAKTENRIARMYGEFADAHKSEDSTE